MAKAKKRKLVIGKATLTVAAGKSLKLTFKLNRKGAAALRKLKRVAVKLTFTARAGTGIPVTATRTVTLKAPAKRKR